MKNADPDPNRAKTCGSGSETLLSSLTLGHTGASCVFAGLFDLVIFVASMLVLPKLAEKMKEDGIRQAKTLHILHQIKCSEEL